MTLDLTFSYRAAVSLDVLSNEVEGELVILDLNSEQYFGLNETGTAIWKAITQSATIEDAYQELLAVYEVEPERLRADLTLLLEELNDRGLLEIRPSER